MDNANNIFERKNVDGSVDYIVNLGNILYNDKVVTLSNLLIPLKQQLFFILPEEKRYYAAVNVYYSVDSGAFVFNTVKKSERYIDSWDSDIVSNVIPIGQFILQQTLASFEVRKINLYSKMSTFTVTDTFIQGDRGAQGEVGDTGFIGYTGAQGYTGAVGFVGDTGAMGETGVGAGGHTGMQGATGIYPDLNLYLYCKFKSFDEKLVDYSVYERDMMWGATGAGITGLVYLGPTGVGDTGPRFLQYTGSGTGIILLGPTGGDTGIEFIEYSESTHELQDGLIDDCRKAIYNGGKSGYTRNSYFGFTGVIHAWVNVDQPPIADFIYEIQSFSGAIGYPVRFINASLFYPDSTVWDIDGSIYDSPIITHSFGATGMHMVKLTVTNASGYSIKRDLLTIE